MPATDHRTPRPDRSSESAAPTGRIALLLATGLMLHVLAGCAAPQNPSFPLSTEQAKKDLVAMEADPKPLRRPLIIVAGWGDPGFADGHLYENLTPALDDQRVARVDFKDTTTFDECRERLIAAVDEAFGPGDRSDQTIEVDVVANSMGGLIAAYAADQRVDGRRLRMARLFALSAPFRGATMAGVPTDSPILLDMRVDSEFVRTMNAPDQLRDYEIYPYARLGDTWVGLENTAPPGQWPWWVPNAPLEPAHLVAFTDPRLKAEVLRRLRGETPYTTEPRTPPPGAEE